MADERIPLTILKNLLHDEVYARKVLPFVQSEYFDERTDRILFEEIGSYIRAYDGLPTKEVLYIETENRTDLTQEEFVLVKSLID